MITKAYLALNSRSNRLVAGEKDLESDEPTPALLHCGQKSVGEQLWVILPASVPALLYLLQNNLVFLALDCLDVTDYVVIMQLKTLWAAAFSICIL